MKLQKCDEVVREAIGTRGDRCYRSIKVLITVSGDLDAGLKRLQKVGIATFVKRNKLCAKVSIEDLVNLTDEDWVQSVQGDV